MNNVLFQGNLVDNVKVNNTQDGKTYAFGTIGVYNGKTKEGEIKPSMFFNFIVFGRDAEDLQLTGKKGQPIIVSGKLEEDKNVTPDGKEYINKKINCTYARVIAKIQRDNGSQPVVIEDPFAQEGEYENENI